MKKLLALLLTTLLCTLGISSAMAQPQPTAMGTPPATMGIVMTYDANGSPLEIRRDPAGTVQLDGLPYPGLVLYVPTTRTLYYQHPSDPQWITLNPTNADQASTPVKLQKGNDSQPWQGQPTQHWRLHGGPSLQADLFASTTLAQQAGLTAHHLTSILATLEWLTAGAASGPENRLALTQLQGVQVGLPTQWPTPNGTYVLTQLIQAPVAPITVPTATQPLTDELRLQILLSQFGEEEKTAFLKAHARLPIAVQLAQLQQALAADYDAPREP